MFSQLSFPGNDVKFLYERSAKMSDSVYYQNMCPDPTSTVIWNLLYEEMFYAAHDTSWMQSVEEVTSYQNQFYGDTVVIGIMDYMLYHFRPGALTTGDYLIFDSVQNQFFDHPNPVETPYDRMNIFSAAALKIVHILQIPCFE